MTTETLTPTPGPACASFAALLPVLDDAETESAATAALRAHLPTCAYCRAQLAAYDQLDAALVRALGPSAVAPLRTDDLLAAVFAASPEVTAWHSGTGAEQAVAMSSLRPRAPRPVAFRPRGPRRFSGLAALAAVLLVAVLAGVVFAGRRPGPASGGPHPTTTTLPAQTIAPTATLVPRGSPTASSNCSGPAGGHSALHASLTRVALVSPTAGWALGTISNPNNPNGSQGGGVLLAFDGVQWCEVGQSYNQQLNAISMDAPNDGWIVGNGGLLLHYDGATWTQVQAPTGLDLHDVQMLAPKDGWAVGSNENQVVALHYDGGAWHMVPLPAAFANGPGQLITFMSIFMVSPTDGWAAGADYPNLAGAGSSTDAPTGYLLHYIAGAWQIAATFPRLAVDSLSLSSSTDGWAAADKYPTGSGESPSPVMLRLAQGRWSEFGTPQGDTYLYNSIVNHMTDSAAGSRWLITHDGTNAGNGYSTAAYTFNGSAWNHFTFPAGVGHDAADIYDVAAVPGTNDAWAVGLAWNRPAPNVCGPPNYTGCDGTYRPLIEHYVNGDWLVFAD
jgi:hypothetical protein